MRKVKAGDEISIGEIKYRVGESSAEAINFWLELSERISHADPEIHLFIAGSRGKDGNFVKFSKIKAALKKRR